MHRTLLFTIVALLALVPISGFGANRAFGFIDGYSIENQSVTLPVLFAHGYLLAIYFCFGRQAFRVRLVVLTIGAMVLALESIWIHATLADLREPRYFLHEFNQNLVVFVVPPTAMAFACWPIRALFARNQCRLTILDLLLVITFVSGLLACLRGNPFLEYLYDWDALGEITLLNTVLAVSMYCSFIVRRPAIAVLGILSTLLTMGYQFKGATSYPWDLISIGLPWIIYVPALFTLRRYMVPWQSCDNHAMHAEPPSLSNLHNSVTTAAK